MLRWKPKHQFTKSLRDFLVTIPGVLFGVPGAPMPTPRVPLVLRLGVAGPLQFRGAGEELSLVVNAILAAVKQYADAANPEFHRRLFSDGSAPPPVRLRFVGQLAAGFDQMVASAALAGGYGLHVVLPGSRAAVAQDIRRTLPDEALVDTAQETGPTASGRPAASEVGRDTEGAVGALAGFAPLLEAAERVLELDRDDVLNDAASFTHSDFAQAGLVILDHSDLVLVAVHDELHPALGGTRWIADRAEERDLAVIEIPVARPMGARLIWTVDGRREERLLFQEGSRETDAEVFAPALDERLLGLDFDLAKTRLGELERRAIAQLSPVYNEREWDRRWQLDAREARAEHYLGHARQHVDRDLKEAKIWADLRASALAELVRGSFIFGALLGVVAVFGALAGIFFPVPLVSLLGKVLEISCLAIIIWLAVRSRRRNWRSHWLSLRQLERYVEQTAWLLLLGRCQSYDTPSHLANFQTEDIAKWANCYFRALIRNTSFPTAHFTPDYLNTVHLLALQNLVIDQISYLQDEAQFEHISDKVLARWTWACVIIAAAVTCAYLPYGLKEIILHTWESRLSEIVGALGALFTATAAALAAIRSHGEYAQIAARYEGTWEALKYIQNRLDRRLPDRRPDYAPPRLRSAWLASSIGEATESLIGEVQGWRATLQKKEIEPT